MTNVALYARVSSEQQADAGTIRSQISSLLEKITADGFSLPNTELQFVDEGYSGCNVNQTGVRTAKRQHLQRCSGLRVCSFA